MTPSATRRVEWSSDAAGRRLVLACGDEAPAAFPKRFGSTGNGFHHDPVTTQEYHSDPRLARLYDTVCSGRHDIDFYLALAHELGATTIVDVGCGTGLLATELAGRGHRVTGVDPSRTMLAVARSRPGHEQVEWIDGDATAVPALDAELAIMTGHVAQVFLDDSTWTTTLRAVHRALVPGGRLAFETRHPAARAWLRWNPQDSLVRVDGAEGPVEVWHEVTKVEGDLVTFDEHHRFLASGDLVVERSTLRFPELDQLTALLTAAGFGLERAYGDWDRSAVNGSSPELILVARKVTAAGFQPVAHGGQAVV
jgi:ubiquinone/menaquinone biosynthesis C-methylase UbiE